MKFIKSVDLKLKQRDIIIHIDPWMSNVLEGWSNAKSVDFAVLDTREPNILEPPRIYKHVFAHFLIPLILNHEQKYKGYCYDEMVFYLDKYLHCTAWVPLPSATFVHKM